MTSPAFFPAKEMRALPISAPRDVERQVVPHVRHTFGAISRQPQRDAGAHERVRGKHGMEGEESDHADNVATGDTALLDARRFLSYARTPALTAVVDDTRQCMYCGLFTL